MSFFENTRKPTGLGGRLMVRMMNLGHRKLAAWGLRFASLSPAASVLDCGCGGGANLKALLKKFPDGTVCGIDYSPVSVQKSQQLNRRAIASGRCAVYQASVTGLPFKSAQFDLVTAFETVYFWPGLVQSFSEVRRVLRPGAAFLICNECSGDSAKDDKWVEAIPGMTIYRDVQLKAALEQAGFSSVQIFKHKKGWLCVTAQNR